MDNMEIKQGDKVRVSKDAQEIFMYGLNPLWFTEESTVVRTFPDGVVIKLDANNYLTTGLHIPTKYLIKVEAEAKEPTAPTIKVGDRVRHMKVGQTWKVTAINGDLFTLKSDFGHENVCFGAELELIQPKEQTEAEKKSNHAIAIPVEVDITDSYWDAYTADLAKEIALKVANKYNDPEQAAEYAVSVAKAVVENLKNK